MSPQRVHLIGIGGIGLSAIARVLLGQGITVSGSDLSPSPLTDELEKAGAKISVGHRAENVAGADLVVVTSAAPPDNPEIVEARRRSIRVVNRHDYFPELTRGYRTIAIAGTHGKTTTTGMIATLLVAAALDPTAVVGGIIPELGGNARAGHGEYFVVEADEYDRAFLGLTPHIAVVTSIEMDHPDCYRDVEDVAKAFRELMGQVVPGGLVVGCGDAARVAKELSLVRGPRVVTYGAEAGNDWRADEIRVNSDGGSSFTVWQGTTSLGRFDLQVPGRHNVLNALAALAVGNEVGVGLEVARTTLHRFRGAARRLEFKGEPGGVVIIDDYAHHPTEIKAGLAAVRARYPGRKIWAVFQPHTYSRTQALLSEFAEAFADADHVIVTDIYAARERENRGVHGSQITDRMKHPDAHFVGSLDETVDYLLQQLSPGDILITLGAGDVHRVGTRVGAARRGDG